jgi:hypothetical protein
VQIIFQDLVWGCPKLVANVVQPTRTELTRLQTSCAGTCTEDAGKRGKSEADVGGQAGSHAWCSWNAGRSGAIHPLGQDDSWSRIIDNCTVQC